ncbi:hypothetical protein BDQ12DRAFT_738188 [Crucibulum laeve]|uniref:DUF6604 domain-containing protein n=1 Tax=Crucibulum laeve TaxID=68775 RepID=A0A5C3LNR9_9AGAR|nr:hypothetical protein BDQ12DRAFT_738188 [Crucibulum laeve]
MSAFSKTPLPPSIRSSYAQYKHNSSLIIRWAHTTAARIREAANPTPVMSNLSRGKGNRGRSRGNSRSGARLTQSSRPQYPDLAKPQHTLREFLGFINEIASSRTAIPKLYLSLLALTVRQRKCTASYYSSDTDAWRDNQGHINAIRVFEEALNILKRAYEEQQKHTKKGEDRWVEESVAVGDGPFALNEAMHQIAVAIEEDELAGSQTGDEENEWIRDNVMINPQARKLRDKQTFPLEAYVIVPEDGYQEDEEFLALKDFLLDIWQLRDYCAKLWKDVAPAGNTSHMTASFVTNHAVQMVKQMEYDLVAEFPALEDVDEGYRKIFENIGHDLMTKPETVFDNILHQLMYWCWYSVDAFGTVLNNSPSPLMRDGHFGYFDPQVAWESLNSFEKTRQVKCILGTYWPDLVLIYRYNIPSFIGEQGLGKDFRKYMNNKSRPLTWALIFACQMQFDSVQCRRQYLDYDVSVMRSLGRQICADMDEFTNDGVLYSDIMDGANYMISKFRPQIHRWLLTDPVYDMKIRNGWDKMSQQASEKGSTWRMNPWLTANAISEATIMLYHAGALVTGAGGMIGSAMHLWNMLRQTGYLEQPEDSAVALKGASKDHILLFDHLIDVFGDDVFSGPLPKKDFFKQIEIMLGVRPEAYAREKRKLKKTATASSRKAHNDIGRGILPEVSDAFNLHEADYFPSKATKSVAWSSVEKSEIHPLAATRALIESELGQSRDGSKARGPLINLNLLKVHRLCVRLFTELDRVMPAELERVFYEGVYEDWITTQVQWPFITASIARSMEITKDGKVEPGLLRVAAEVVKKVAGSKELGFYVVKEEGDESLILK